jgi:hypothetical protein
MVTLYVARQALHPNARECHMNGDSRFTSQRRGLRTRRGWSAVGLAPATAGLIVISGGFVGAGLAGSPALAWPAAGSGLTASVRPSTYASQPVIVSPAAGSLVCAGNLELAGRETNSSLITQQASATWSYTPSGEKARAVRPTAVDDVVGAGLYGGLWNDSAVPAGHGTLTLTLGYDQGEIQGTATRPVVLYAGPSLGPIRWKQAHGKVVLSGTLGGSDPGGGLLHWEWFFGDGHTSTLGRTVTHDYAAGKYVVAVRVTDDHGCTSTRYGELDVPVPGNAGELKPVDWCDPLGFRSVDQEWPASDQLGLPKGRFPVGRTTAGKILIGYGLQVQFTVFGDPAYCQTHQFVKIEQILENATDGTTVWLSGDARALTDDGYDHDYARRRTEPSASGNGTSTITWVDVISILKNPGDTNGEILFEVLDVIKGQEAKIPDGDLEREPPAGEHGTGESAYQWFRGCVTLTPPAGRKDSSYKSIANDGPDAAYPAAAKNANGPATHVSPGGANITGC